jgi:hypothetical protein
MRAPADRLRFQPPPLKTTPHLAWVLARAFAAPDFEVPRPTDPPHALSLAQDLDLLGRIASRIPDQTLALELGAPGLMSAIAERRRVAASTLRILRTAGRVAEIAAGAGLPVAFLKGTALHLTGHALVSARSASDVDVLVPGGRARDLQHALVAAGFEPRGTTRSLHHLAPLGQRGDPWVEVHLEIPGCVVPGSDGSMNFETLDGNDYLVPLVALPGRSVAPAPAILAAHALVHGIDDHGFGADRYPPMRMLCDLADVLGPAPLPPPIAGQVGRFVGDAVSPVEREAALNLVARLVLGDLTVLGEPGPAGTLLAHLVAGALDPDYRDALRLRQVAFLVRHRPAAIVRDKLGHRMGTLSPEPGPVRLWNAATLLARLLRAEVRVRRACHH